MNNNFEEHIKHVAGKVRLSDQEKQGLKADFKAFMDQQSVPARKAPTPSPFAFILHYRASLAAFTLILLTATTSVSAENSLPGELLYNIKTNINEKIYQGVSFTPKLKAEAHINIATKRLTELEAVMAKQDPDDKESIDELGESLSEHTDAAFVAIDDLSEDGDKTEGLKAALLLQSTLETHGEILEGLERAPETTLTISTEVTNTPAEETPTIMMMKVAPQDLATEEDKELAENDGVDLSAASTLMIEDATEATSTDDNIDQLIENAKTRVRFEKDEIIERASQR